MLITGDGTMLQWFRSWFRKLEPRAVAEQDFRSTQAVQLQAWFALAAVRGKPKYLIWNSAELLGEVAFAEDRESQRFVALLEVIVQWEPEPGSPLADVPQASEPRRVVAIFWRERSAWHTDGRAIMNLSVQQVLEQKRFQKC